jgi:hypothetical protein
MTESEFDFAEIMLLAGIIGHLKAMIYDADCEKPCSAKVRDSLYTSNARRFVNEYDALIEDRMATREGVLKP